MGAGRLAGTSEPAKIFEGRQTPGQWRVEWFDDDGRCELEIFTGPEARRQSLRYAMQKYAHFKGVQLERTRRRCNPSTSLGTIRLRAGLGRRSPPRHLWRLSSSA
jgi:hypothetical protein